MGGDVPGPDPNIGLAALRNSELAGEALTWYRDYTDRVLTPLQQEQAGLNRQVTQQSMQIAGENAALAREAADYQRNTFRPIEASLAKEAAEFNTDAHRERQAGLAGADVQSAFAQAAAEQRADQARRGVAPTSGVAAALNQDLALKKAAAMASASNTARDNATTLGWAKKMDSASLGRGLASQQATNSQLALQAGNAASGASGASLQGAAGVAGTMGQGFGQATQANSAAGSLWGQSSGQAIQAGAANQSNNAQMVGTGVGAVASIAAIAL